MNFLLGSLTTGLLSAALALPAYAANPQPASKLILSAVLKEVQASAKDPDSVKIRNVKTLKDGSLTKFCGEVNAKNSYGGYTGYKPMAGFLLVTGGRVSHITVSDIDNSDLSAAMCQRDGF